MAHQHYIDIQLAEHRRQFLAALDDVAVIYVGCRGVYRVVEYDRLPSHIRILRDRALQEFLMLCRGAVVGVDHHEQRVVIDEPVVRSRCRRTELRALIRQVEVLVVCGRSAVVVTDRRRARQIGQRIVQVAGVLRLIVVGVDLVAGRYQEIRIQLCDGRIERLIPAYGIGLRIACADLRVAGEDEAEALIEITGLKGIDLADGVAIDHTVHIRCVFFQVGHGCLIAVEPFIVGGDGSRSGFVILCREQAVLHIRLLCPLHAACRIDIRIPSQVSACLI